MPVTFPVSPVAAQAVPSPLYRPMTDAQILARACEAQSRRVKELLQSSITDEERPSLLPETNGFVRTVLEAYASHRHLVLRPDDVWMAILTQLSFYVNAHAEELREYFVAHEGKKELIVEAVGNRYSVDFGYLSRRMTREIHENVVDSTLVDWILPDFSTTTTKDRTVSAVIMMSTLKEYFVYGFVLTCGIPTITLLGTQDDWQALLRRLDRLPMLGAEPAAWAQMLRPILRRFVDVFDNPEQPDLGFWRSVVHKHSEGCGEDVLSGWVTAFCVWDHKGVWKAGKLPERPEVHRDGKENAAGKQEANLGRVDIDRRFRSRREYMLDGVQYFTIRVQDIPAGYCEVDVTVNDNGVRLDCNMIAGHVASKVLRSEPDGEKNTLTPSAQWFIYEKRSSPMPNHMPWPQLFNHV
ncbi:hypothetical protein BN946_scf184790.g9 [Trametes cinnabarina]|uniref:Uncharacterized protein n=1 Tax=Pycnoporus cinnabarinus TaxID=5643 RepID=A0A060S2W7_PYCCI|nr:hypothetical protein BN946_scf184790.g9 [Trametes cinnabarina]